MSDIAQAVAALADASKTNSNSIGKAFDCISKLADKVTAQDKKIVELEKKLETANVRIHELARVCRGSFPD